MFKKIEYGEIRYYNDPSIDDFMNTKINEDTIVDENYIYLNKKIIPRILSFLLYYGIAIPVLVFYGYIIKGIKVKGRKNLKDIKSGYILYGNHTNVMDAFLGHVFIARPRRTYIVASKDAVSIKGLKHIVRALGGLPVPDTMTGLKNLNYAIKECLEKNKVLVVYPEAHIWPYYTGLREFPKTSFRFAINNNVPAVPFAITYRKPQGLFKNYKKPKPTINIGKPIYCKEELNAKENINYLHEFVYQSILDMVNKDNIALYQYVQNTQKEEK